MRYEVISADCHVDLCWLPTDLFTTNASAAMRDRVPYVTEGPSGPVWVTKKGANLGHVNGMGSAGREYVPGQIHRSDRMASTGLYDDGKKQWAIKGKPLYYWAKDTKPGDMTGDGLMGAWHVVKP